MEPFVSSNPRSVNRSIFACALAACGLFLSTVSAHDREASSRDSTGPAETYFTNVTLVNQDGQSKRLYRDLIQNKVIVINSFFASCEDSCPPSMKTMTKVQALFSEHMGQDLHMISISVDPEKDTPPKLKEYFDKLKIGPGWQLLTGNKNSVDFALKKIGQYAKVKDAHSNIVIIGNEKTGLWKKALVHTTPEKLAEIVASVLYDTTKPEIKPKP